MLNLQSQCCHKLILAFDDHRDYKVGRIIQCFCPACGKKEDIYLNPEIEESVFKNSKFIDLTIFPISIFYKRLSFISEYIFSNYEYFYNDNVSEKEIAKSILDLIKAREKEEEYLNVKVLTKDKKQE